MNANTNVEKEELTESDQKALRKRAGLPAQEGDSGRS